MSYGFALTYDQQLKQIWNENLEKLKETRSSSWEVLKDWHPIFISPFIRRESDSTELGLSMADVLDEKARIEGYEYRKRRYLTTGNLDLPLQMARFTIYQR